jgi:hypothetical protein
MKLLNKFILIICSILFTLNKVISLKDKVNTKGSKCAVSSISIPKGSNLPIVVFKASFDEEDFKLTVLEKEHMNKLNVKGHLVMDDKNNGESWYVEKKYDEANFENMRDAFSLCRNIHEENKELKLYDENESNRKNNNLLKFRIQSLPDNVDMIEDKEKVKNDSSNLRNKNDNNRITPIFLETKSKKKTLSKVEAKEFASDNKSKGVLKNDNNEEKGFNLGSFIRFNGFFNFNDVHF